MRDPEIDGPDQEAAEDRGEAGSLRNASGRIEPRSFRGTRDFLPAEMIRREELFSYLRGVFRRYGFSPLETPAMEYLEILLGKYGREGEKLIYPLHYKGGNVLALRYDLTVPLARVVASHPELPRPFKRYQMQPVWRADRPQPHQGHYREFYQCDVDIVGESGALADVEVLALTAETLQGLGVGDFRVLVNHREILLGLVEAAGLPLAAAPAVLRAIDKVDKVGLEGIESEMAAEGIEASARRRILDLLALPSGGVEAIRALAAARPDLPAIERGCASLLEIWEALAGFDLDLSRFEFRLAMARGLDYYTGAVFESVLESLPHLGSLSGGGRYDGLVGLFSEEDLPAVGTTIGIDRIFTALQQLGQGGQRATRTQVLVLQFAGEARTAALSLTARLRRAGLNTEIWYRAEKLKKQLGQADRRGVPLVLFQGPDEAARGEWTGKCLGTGEQRSLRADSVEELVSLWLAELATGATAPGGGSPGAR